MKSRAGERSLLPPDGAARLDRVAYNGRAYIASDDSGIFMADWRNADGSLGANLADLLRTGDYRAEIRMVRIEG